MRRVAGQQRAGNDRMAVGLADLLLQAVHVGREPHVEQHRGIDVAGPGVGCGVIEQRRQIAEIGHEDADGSVVKRDGHDFGFSGWHRAGIWSKSGANVQ